MYQKVPYKRVFATIDLDAVAFNMESMRKNIRSGTDMMGVVKADGYGHGAVPVARAMEPYVWGYAAAASEEALLLRAHGITKPILVLSPVHPSEFSELIQKGIRITVFTREQAEAAAECARAQGLTAYIHLALDTGMSRIGMKPDEESADLAAEISRMEGICVEGLFTHFARADEAKKDSTRKQMEHYCQFVELLDARGVKIPRKHVANSAGIIDFPEMGCDMVRAGITVYGMYPSDEVDKARVPLKPAMSLKSYVTYIKTIEPGTEVSYGGTFVASHTMRVATVCIGYGDGYPRSASGKGRVLIHGKSAPILGRVCMDQLMVDVTGIPETEPWDVVTLVGEDGAERISMEELAEASGGFHYELACVLGKRVPRVYIKDGKIIGTKDYFHDQYEDFLV